MPDEHCYEVPSCGVLLQVPSNTKPMARIYPNSEDFLLQLRFVLPTWMKIMPLPKWSLEIRTRTVYHTNPVESYTKLSWILGQLRDVLRVVTNIINIDHEKRKCVSILAKRSLIIKTSRIYVFFKQVKQLIWPTITYTKSSPGWLLDHLQAFLQNLTLSSDE